MAEYFDPSPRASKRRKTGDAQKKAENHMELDASPPLSSTPDTAKKARNSVRSRKVRDKNVDIFTDDHPRNRAEEANGTTLEDVGEEGSQINGTNRPTKPTRNAERRTPRRASASTRKKEVHEPEVEIAHEGYVGDVMSENGILRQQDRADSTNLGDSDVREESQDEDSEALMVTRSSGRERRKPRRFSVSPERSKQKRKPAAVIGSTQQDETAPSSAKKPIEATPRGILTPSGRKRGRSQKSVVFDQDERTIEKQLGFKDIDSSKKSSTKKKVVSESISTERRQDDEVLLTPTKKAGSKSVSRTQISLAEAQHSIERADGEEDDLLIEQLIENPLPPENVLVPTKPANDLQDVEEDPTILAIKSEIMSRIVSAMPPDNAPIPSYLQNQYTNLHNLLAATITTGESNSLLLLGSRGCGKTRMLNIALQDLTKKHGDDFHIVRLNGFFQTDDKLALREIWRQLGREMELDETETEGVSNSYADTMASLLSLLSHPDDFLDHEETADSIAARLDVDDGNQGVSVRTSKSIVFILDEFDLFTTHPRQTLLYNLFDIAQSRKAPIIVIGCSTRMDVVECLEKRVKSRFSHRWLHIPSARSLEAFQEIVESTLKLDEDGGDTRKSLLRGRNAEGKIDVEARKRWNQYIQTSFLPSGVVQDLIQNCFHTTRSISDLLAALRIPLALLHLPESTDSPSYTQPPTRKSACSAPPSLVTLLPSLSTLHLSLLITAARLDAIYSLSAFNYNIIYDHYTELVTRSKLQQTASGALAVGAGLRQWTSDTTRRTWEDLGAWGLVVPVSGKSSGVSTHNRLALAAAASELIGGEGASTRMWRVDVTLEDLTWALKEKTLIGSDKDGNGSGRGVGAGAVDVLAKWCRDV